MGEIRVSELEGAELDYWVAKAELDHALEKLELHPLSPGRWTINFQDDGSVAGYICGGVLERMKTVRELNLRLGEWHYWPSGDWACGGPIIQRERLYIAPVDAGGTFIGEPQTKPGWLVRGPGAAFNYRGDTPLIAAMRAYVASKFGDSVRAAAEIGRDGGEGT